MVNSTITTANGSEDDIHTERFDGMDIDIHPSYEFMNGNNTSHSKSKNKNRTLTSENEETKIRNGNNQTTTTTTTTSSPTTSPTKKNNKKETKSTTIQPPQNITPIDSRKRSEKIKQAKTSKDPSVNIHDERQKKRDACNSYCKKPDELLKIVQYVLYKFQNGGDASFNQFKQIWKDQLQTLNRFFESQPLNQDVIHILYYGVLGYTMLNQPIINKSGIIFSLYTLYNSQIVVPKVPIVLTINLWESLLSYYDDLRVHRFEEGYRAFRELRKSGAFVFSASPHPISTLNVFKNNSLSLKMPVIPSELVGKDNVKPLCQKFDELRNIDERYKEEKLKAYVGYPNSIRVIYDDFIEIITNATDQNALLKHNSYMESSTPAIP